MVIVVGSEEKEKRLYLSVRVITYVVISGSGLHVQ